MGSVHGASLDHRGGHRQREGRQQGDPETRERGRLIIGFLSCTGGPVAPAQTLGPDSLTPLVGSWLSATLLVVSPRLTW